MVLVVIRTFSFLNALPRTLALMLLSYKASIMILASAGVAFASATLTVQVALSGANFISDFIVSARVIAVE